MKIHIDAIHEGKKPHKCSICDHSCTTKTNLKHHFTAVHEGKKPHKCSICDQSFALKYQLKKHADLVHGGKINTTTKDNFPQPISAV